MPPANWWKHSPNGRPLNMQRLTHILLGLVIALAVVANRAAAEIPFVDGDRILVLGDSITQNGQYVALVEAYLWAAYPDRDLDIINAGLSSETVSGITEPVHPNPRPNVHKRLAKALELSKPNWVIVCYGMNDGIYHPESPQIVDAYREGMQQLIDRVAEQDAKLVLLTPPSFDVQAPPIQARLAEVTQDEPYGYRNPFPEYDQTLVKLGEIVKSLQSHDSVERVIDVHQATDAYLKRVKAANPQYAYGDGVHPPADGHLAMALGLLAGLGCDTEEARSRLEQLTGLRPADQAGEATEAQRQFHQRLLARFNQRSAAYRQAIGSDKPVAADAEVLREIDAAAESAEAELRTLVSTAIATNDEESVYARYAEAAEKRWASEMARIEKLNATETHPDDAVLFIGSSSIRLWDTIQADVAPYQPIQRGYGGARYSDLAVFAERLITPHRYRAMVVFVGNDVTGSDGDLSLSEIERLARYVVGVSRAHQPDAPVLLVEVTPTSSRYRVWPQIRRVNDLLREITLTEPNTYFIPTAEYYLDPQNKPVDRYFRSDLLHLNEQGYAVWTALIKRRLDEVVRAGATEPLTPH